MVAESRTDEARRLLAGLPTDEAWKTERAESVEMYGDPVHLVGHDGIEDGDIDVYLYAPDSVAALCAAAPRLLAALCDENDRQERVIVAAIAYRNATVQGQVDSILVATRKELDAALQGLWEWCKDPTCPMRDEGQHVH